MGKNIDQIATFHDLFKIGYRFKSEGTCVTYSDLSNAEYIPGTADLNKMTGIAKVGYSPTKCVKWSDVPGTGGQNTSEYATSGGVRCPVKCTIINQLGLTKPTRATNIIFYYNYKTIGGINSKVPVGSINLGQDNPITSEGTGVCTVLVNPKAPFEENANDKKANWLSVECGTSHDPVNFRAFHSNTDGSVINASVGDSRGVKSYEIWTDVMDVPTYHLQLRSLAEVKFTIYL
jgi:hypothetical protein